MNEQFDTISLILEELEEEASEALTDAKDLATLDALMSNVMIELSALHRFLRAIESKEEEDE